VSTQFVHERSGRYVGRERVLPVKVEEWPRWTAKQHSRRAQTKVLSRGRLCAGERSQTVATALAAEEVLPLMGSEIVNATCRGLIQKR
jgi:hypothetical protein